MAETRLQDDAVTIISGERERCVIFRVPQPEDPPDAYILHAPLGLSSVEEELQEEHGASQDNPAWLVVYYDHVHDGQKVIGAYWTKDRAKREARNTLSSEVRG